MGMYKQKFYLAAPFFNPVQIELIEQIESCFCRHGVPLFSPRSQDANKNRKLTDADADLIYKTNCENIPDAQYILAVLDWKLPEGQAVHVTSISAPSFSHPESCLIKSPPLQIPDSGTVWEMGFAAGWNYRTREVAFNKEPPQLQTIIFTERPVESSLNIMLTRGIAGIIRGVDKLNQFLNQGKLQIDLLEQHKGNHQ